MAAGTKRHTLSLHQGGVGPTLEWLVRLLHRLILCQTRYGIRRSIPSEWRGGTNGKNAPRSLRPFLVDLAAYAQLYDWFRYIHMHILGVRVSAWTLDDYRNRIYYGLEDEAATVDLGRKLAEMHAPCFLVAVEVIGRIHALGGLDLR